MPDEITIGMLLDRIAQPDCDEGLHVRRLPAQHRAGAGSRRSADAAGKQIDRAIYIRVPTDELVRRLAGRWSCPNCGAVYHETNQPPQRARSLRQLRRRSSTSAKTTSRRSSVRASRVNMKNLEPLLDHYRKQRKLSEIRRRAASMKSRRTWSRAVLLEGER